MDEPPTSEDAERYASALCQAAVDCDCSRQQQLPEDCEQDVFATFSRVIEQDSVRFNRECFERRVSLLESGNDACSPEAWADQSCSVFEGLLPGGAACDYEDEGQFGLVDSICASGRWCRQRQCLPPPIVSNVDGIPVGGECSNFTEPCVAGSYCSPHGVCTVPVEELGAVCDAPLACGAPLYCAGITEIGDVGQCADISGIGEACEEDVPLSCGFGSVACVDAVCEGPLPPVCSLLGPFDGQYLGIDWLPLVP